MHYVFMMPTEKRDKFLSIFNSNPVKIRCVGGWSFGKSLLGIFGKKNKGKFARVGNRNDDESHLEKVTAGSMMKRNRLAYLPHEMNFK